LFPNQTGETGVGATGSQWHDVLITKIGSQITWNIDGLPIVTIDAATVTLGGSNILFNYFDINAGSSTDPNSASVAFGLIDNVRVEALSTTTPQAPEVLSIAIISGNVQIDFAGSSSDTPEVFTLQSSANAESGYTNEGAIITQVGPGRFHVQ